MDYPRRELMDHVAYRENIELLASRQIGIANWRHVFVADRVAESGNGGRTDNLSAGFRRWLDEKLDEHFSPEEVMGYIYAVLHAPTFRTRFIDFLRIDFPHVPFTERADHFEELAILGWALLEAHLLREFPRKGLASYYGNGDHTIKTVHYSPDDQVLAINERQFFKPVPKAVWDFHIGGYPVIDKYLRSRGGETLKLEEIDQVAAIADSLAFTIE
jgi:predicted helicase